MTDIVERLRASNSAGMLCDEAAGEIEWLRQEHERLRAALREIVAYDALYGIRDEGDGQALVSIARAALKEGKDG